MDYARNIISYRNIIIGHLKIPYFMYMYLFTIAEPAVKACPSLNDFNNREHVTTTSWGNKPTVTLWVS